MYYLELTPFFPTKKSFRGAYILDQAKAIQRTGKYKVIVIRSKPLNSTEEDYEYDGVRVLYCPAQWMPSYFLSGLTNSLNAFLFLRFLAKREIKIQDIKVAHAHTALYAVYAAILKKKNSHIKTLIQYHDRDPYQIRNGIFAKSKFNILYKTRTLINLFQFLDYHVCISRVVEDNLLSFPLPAKFENYKPYLEILKKVKNIPPIKKIKTIILYNGVDTSKFYPIEGKKEQGVFKIGCIANFVSLKGHMTLIKAVEHLINNQIVNKIKISLIGSGPTLPICVEYIKSHKLDSYFSFETEVNHNELLNFYNSLDLFVLPSIYEGFGCVLTEAYACGVPFMMCEYQGAAECILDSEKHKWLFTPNDDHGLAKLIQNFYYCRDEQILQSPYQIEILIEEFLKKIEIN